MQFIVNIRKIESGNYEAELYANGELLITHERKTVAHVLLALALEMSDNIDPTEE